MFVRIALAIAVLILGLGCAEEKIPLPAVYSDPKSGRVLDFGPEGLVSEINDNTIVVGSWTLSEKDQLTITKLTEPSIGQSSTTEAQNGPKALRLVTPGEEVYQEYVREPIAPQADKTLVGLWMHQREDRVDLYEFTPWGTCMWVRLATHTGEPKVVGGAARCRIPQPGVLGLKGRELDYEITDHDNYTYVVEGTVLSVTNSKTKEVIRYEKVPTGKLKDLLAKV